jgi:DNA polymerase alpha subunit A
MEEGPRSRRVARPGKAAGALAQLAELRRTGAKHVDAYEVREEEAVFDTVAEDEYADIVAKRRGDAGACSALTC